MNFPEDGASTFCRQNCFRTVKRDIQETAAQERDCVSLLANPNQHAPNGGVVVCRSVAVLPSRTRLTVFLLAQRQVLESKASLNMQNFRESGERGWFLRINLQHFAKKHCKFRTAFSRNSPHICNRLVPQLLSCLFCVDNSTDEFRS